MAILIPIDFINFWEYLYIYRTPKVNGSSLNTKQSEHMGSSYSQNTKMPQAGWGNTSKGTTKLLTGATDTCIYRCPDGHRQGRKQNGTVPILAKTTTTKVNHGEYGNNTAWGELDASGNFRTMALGDTTHVIVYGPICLSVSFLDGWLIWRFLVLSHTWSPSLYFGTCMCIQSAKHFMSSCALCNATLASSWIFFN